MTPRLPLLFAALALGFQATAAECESLKFSGNADYPPVLWRDAGDPAKLVGVSAELLELTGRELGVAVRVEYAGSWAEAQKLAREGKIDGLAGAFWTEERTVTMDYVRPPFLVMPSVVFTRKGGAFRFSEWSNLIGLKGVTLAKNSFGQAFDEFAEQKLSVEGAPSFEEALRGLKEGRVDYMLYELYQGYALADRLGERENLEVLPTAIGNEDLYYTLSKKSKCNTEALRRNLALALKELVSKGVPEGLLEKHLGLWKGGGAP